MDIEGELGGLLEESEVLELLKKFGFSEKRWFDLGLALGLSKDTLDAIKANHPQDTRQCLIECLSKWLKRADNVDSKGGATRDSLSTGLRSINENTVAEKLDKESELMHGKNFASPCIIHNSLLGVFNVMFRIGIIFFLCCFDGL